MIGNTVNVTYKIKEGEKDRQQVFRGILIKIRGNDKDNQMITVRKVSRSGLGVERIIPLNSPNLIEIETSKKSKRTRAKLYYIRSLPEHEIRHKIYRQK